jgi:hypothetical protein
MLPALRRLIVRLFGSAEVELVRNGPVGRTTPAPQRGIPDALAEREWAEAANLQGMAAD